MSKGAKNEIKLNKLLKLCNKTKEQNIIEFNTVIDIIDELSKQKKYTSYIFLDKIIEDKNVCKE